MKVVKRNNILRSFNKSTVCIPMSKRLLWASFLVVAVGFGGVNSLSAQSTDCVHIFNSSVTGEKICDPNLVVEQKMKIQNLDAVGFVSNGKFSGSIWIPKDFKFGSAGKIANPVEIKVDQLPITATNQLAANTEVVNKYSDSATAIKALETVNFLVSYEGQASQTFSLKSLTASALTVELTVTPSEANLTPAVPDANNYKLVRSVVLSGAGTKVGNDSNNFNASVNTSSVAFDYNLEFNFDTGVYKVTIKGGSSVVAEVGKYYYFNGMIKNTGSVDDNMTLRTGPGTTLADKGVNNSNSWKATKGDLVRIKSIHKDKITDASGVGTSYKLPTQSFWVEIEKVHTDGKIVSGYIIMYYLSDFSTSLAFKVKTRASGGATAGDFNFNGNSKGEKLEVCLESASKTLLCKTAESTSNVFDVSEGNSKFNIDLKNFLAPASTDVAIFKDTEVKLSLRVYTDVSPNGSSMNKKYTFSLKKNNKQWFSSEFGAEAIWDETERTFYINGRALEPSENNTSTIGGYYTLQDIESGSSFNLRKSNANNDADGSAQKPYNFAGSEGAGNGWYSSKQIKNGHLVKLTNIFSGPQFEVKNNAWAKAKGSKWVQIELYLDGAKEISYIPMAWLKEFNNKLVLNFKSAQGNSEQAFKHDGNEYGDVYGVCLATTAQGTNCPAFGPGQNVTSSDKSSFEINFDSILTTPLQVMTTKVLYVSVKVGVKKNNVVGNKLFTFSVESGNGGWKLKGGADTLVWWHDDEIFDAKGSSSTGTSVGSAVKLGVHRITGQQTMRTQAGYTEANALYAATTLTGGGEWSLTPGELVDVKSKVWDGFTNTYWVEVVSRKKDGSSEVNKNGFIQYKNIERSEMSFEFKLKKKKTSSSTEKLAYDGAGQMVLASVSLCIKDVSTDNTCENSEIGSTLADLGDKASFNMNVETKYGSNPDYLTFKTFWLVANAKLKTNEVKKFSFAVLKDKDTSSWAISEGNDALVWDDETKTFTAKKTSLFSNSLVNDFVSNATVTGETSDPTASHLNFTTKVGDMTVSGNFDNVGCVMGGVYGATTGEARFAQATKAIDEKAWGTFLQYLQDLGFKNVALGGAARAGGYETHCGGNAVDVNVLDGELQKNFRSLGTATSKEEQPKHKKLFDHLFTKKGSTVNQLIGPWRITGSSCSAQASTIAATVASNLKSGQCVNYTHNTSEGGTSDEKNHSHHLHVTMTPSSSGGPLCANKNLDKLTTNLKKTDGTINYGPGGIGFSRSEFNQLICMNVSLSKSRGNDGCMITESSGNYENFARNSLQALSNRLNASGTLKCEIGGQIVDCPKWTGPQPWGSSSYTTDFTTLKCGTSGNSDGTELCNIRLPACDPSILPAVPSFPSFGGSEDSGVSTENPPNNNNTTPVADEYFNLETYVGWNETSSSFKFAPLTYNNGYESKNRYNVCFSADKGSDCGPGDSNNPGVLGDFIEENGSKSKLKFNITKARAAASAKGISEAVFNANVGFAFEVIEDCTLFCTNSRGYFPIAKGTDGVYRIKDSGNILLYNKDDQKLYPSSSSVFTNGGSSQNNNSSNSNQISFGQVPSDQPQWPTDRYRVGADGQPIPADAGVAFIENNAEAFNPGWISWTTGKACKPGETTCTGSVNSILFNRAEADATGGGGSVDNYKGFVRYTNAAKTTSSIYDVAMISNSSTVKVAFRSCTDQQLCSLVAKKEISNSDFFSSYVANYTDYTNGVNTNWSKTYAEGQKSGKVYMPSFTNNGMRDWQLNTGAFGASTYKSNSTTAWMSGVTFCNVAASTIAQQYGINLYKPGSTQFNANAMLDGLSDAANGLASDYAKDYDVEEFLHDGCYYKNAEGKFKKLSSCSEAAPVNTKIRGHQAASILATEGKFVVGVQSGHIGVIRGKYLKTTTAAPAEGDTDSASVYKSSDLQDNPPLADAQVLGNTKALLIYQAGGKRVGEMSLGQGFGDPGSTFKLFFIRKKGEDGASTSQVVANNTTPTSNTAGNFFVAKKNYNLRSEAAIVDPALYKFPADEFVKLLEITSVEVTPQLSSGPTTWGKVVTKECKIGYLPMSFLGSSVAAPSDSSTAYDNDATKCAANMPVVDLANLQKIDQVAGFAFTTTKFTANTSGGFDVTGKLKIKLPNVSVSGTPEREISFKIDNKACFVGSEYVFTSTPAGNWDIQGTWFGSQVGLNFKKLVISSCLNGYLDGSLNMNSQSVMSYVNGDRKFGANVKLTKDGLLLDPNDPSKGPLLTQTGAAISSVLGYGFTPSSIRINNSLADSILFAGKLNIPVNNNGTLGYEKDIVIDAKNGTIALNDISLGVTLATKIQNINLKVSAVRFGQISGVYRMMLKGKILLSQPFTNVEADLAGVGITADGKLMATNEIIGAAGVSANAFGGTIKISNADLVQNEDGQNWDIRGAGKLKVQPKILGVTIPTNELSIPEIQLNYSAAENRNVFKVGEGVEIPNLLNTLNLAAVFSFKSVGVQIVPQSLNGVTYDVIKITAELKSTYEWLKLANRTSEGEQTTSIVVFPDGTTKLDELGLQFKMVEGADGEDTLIKIALTYKNSRVEGALESKWIPVGASIGLDFGEKFGFYVGLSMDFDKLPGPLSRVVGKSLGKMAPVKSVGLKIGYWQPEGADQRRAFIELSAAFKLPPFPIVTLEGKVAIGFSWEASKRIDFEAELSGKIEASMLSSVLPVGDLNLGKINLKAFWDITKGDFGLEIGAAIGPDIKVAELKLDAKANVNFAIGYTNSTWNFYYDTSVVIKAQMEYLSTLIDAGFSLEVAAGIAFGRNNAVKLYVPQSIKTRLSQNGNITVPASFSTGGGFIGYAGGSITFYIDLPGFDKKTWTYDLGIYTHVINGGFTFYAGVNMTTTFFLGDPMEIRLYYVRKPGGYNKVALDIWDVNDHEMWDTFVFETGVVAVTLDGTKAVSGSPAAVKDPVLSTPPAATEVNYGSGSTANLTPASFDETKVTSYVTDIIATSNAWNDNPYTTNVETSKPDYPISSSFVANLFTKESGLNLWANNSAGFTGIGQLGPDTTKSCTSDGSFSFIGKSCNDYYSARQLCSSIGQTVTTTNNVFKQEVDSGGPDSGYVHISSKSDNAGYVAYLSQKYKGLTVSTKTTTNRKKIDREHISNCNSSGCYFLDLATDKRFNPAEAMKCSITILRSKAVSIEGLLSSKGIPIPSGDLYAATVAGAYNGGEGVMRDMYVAAKDQGVAYNWEKMVKTYNDGGTMKTVTTGDACENWEKTPLGVALKNQSWGNRAKWVEVGNYAIKILASEGKNIGTVYTCK